MSLGQNLREVVLQSVGVAHGAAVHLGTCSKRHVLVFCQGVVLRLIGSRAGEVTEVVVVDVETYVCAESKLGQYLPCESSVHVEVLTNTFLIVVVEGCDWVFQSVVDVALIEEKAS